MCSFAVSRGGMILKRPRKLARLEDHRKFSTNAVSFLYLVRKTRVLGERILAPFRHFDGNARKGCLSYSIAGLIRTSSMEVQGGSLQAKSTGEHKHGSMSIHPESTDHVVLVLSSGMWENETPQTSDPWRAETKHHRNRCILAGR